MKQITFYLDFISPYAYLAFEKLPQALQGLGYSVQYKPLLFAGLLKHHGQLGPAEIAPKRDWTYRQVLWLGHSHGIPVQLPASHPFNPLPLLRLALACGKDGLVNRYVAETVFRHVWRSGADAADAARLEALKQTLNPARDPASDEVKAELKANADEAIALGLFG
ncbi:MAG: DsbA family protein, partial [Ramlibacter sp.]